VNVQSKMIPISFNAVENQNGGVRQKGLRMARGRCHRSLSLKHNRYNVFYAELHQNCGRAIFAPALTPADVGAEHRPI